MPGEQDGRAASQSDVAGASGKIVGRWRGSTVVCIASGPSLTADDCRAVKAWKDQAPQERRVIAVNTSFRLAPFADALYACDAPWWTTYLSLPRERGIAHLSDWRGERWSASDDARRLYGVNRIKGRWGDGHSKEPGVIHFGGNSGYQAIELAAQFGARRILLLGYDMQLTDGKHHWHGLHPPNMGNGTNFAVWCRRAVEQAAGLQEAGIEVLNCSRQTALTAFRQFKLEDALA